MALYNFFSGQTTDPPTELERQLFLKELISDSKNLDNKEFDDKWSRKMSSIDKKTLIRFMGPASDDNIREIKKRYSSGNLSAIDNKIKGIQAAEQRAIENEKKQNEAASGIVSQVKSFAGILPEGEKIRSQAKEKFGYEIGSEIPDPRYVVNKAMAEEARSRIQNKEGIPLWYDKRNANTCINGVCTVASNQGMDFSSMAGRDPNTLKNLQGQYIPVQNKSFLANLEFSGYEPIPKGEMPMEGDVAQYFESTGSLGELVPKHAEIVLKTKAKPNGEFDIETFNNYQLTGTGEGLSQRSIGVSNGNYYGDGWADVRFYRPTKEAAAKAVQRKHPQVQAQIEGKNKFEQSDLSKKYNEYQKTISEIESKNLLGEDSSLIRDIAEGFSGRFSNDKDGLRRAIISKAKNPAMVDRVLNLLYSK